MKKIVKGKEHMTGKERKEDEQKERKNIICHTCDV